jgi:hypothetical protein
MRVRHAELHEIDNTLELVKPIPIVIRDYGCEVFAIYSEIEAYGAGLDEASAVANLKSEIRKIYFRFGQWLVGVPGCVSK